MVLILAFSNPSYSEDLADSPVANVQQTFFKSSLTNLIPDVVPETGSYNYSFMSKGRSYREIDPDNMPLFKQMRLKLMNKFVKEDENSQLDENYNPETEEVDTSSNLENTEDTALSSRKSFSDKMKFWKKNDKKISKGEHTSSSDSELTNSIQSETASDMSEDTLSLEGSINEQSTERQLILDAADVDYDEATGDMVATGRPVLDLPPQSVRIIADKMTYNEDSNILRGIGNVIVIKDGKPSRGTFIEVDMNEEIMFMDNAVSANEAMQVDAKKVTQKDGLLIFDDGDLHSDHSEVYRLRSSMIGPIFSSMVVNKDAQALVFGDPTGNKVTLNIDSIYIDAQKNHDVIKAKDIKVYHRDKYLFKWPSITAYTNKQRDYFEANYPELGTFRKVGFYAGPGFVFGGPAGSVIKAIPFINYNHKFGFGGALKYRNTYNSTELGYGSASDVFFLRGVQRLDDNLFLQYAANSYMDEWFLGSRMAKYMSEVYYDKAYMNQDFLGKGKNLQFRHRVGFGLMQDDDRNYNGEKIASSSMATTRTRYMAELSQSLFSYRNDEQRFIVNGNVVMQGSAALYGTGDTQFVARVGPLLHVQYKNWMQDVGYFLSGYSDQSPLPRYDSYRYGHSSVYLAEAFRVTKYFSVGWAGYINLSNDSPNGKMFQENAFIFSFGPDDLKVSLGYDFVRQATYFGFDVAFDTKGTKVNYKKMEIKNPERLGKKTTDDSDRKIAFSAPKKPEPVKNVKKSDVPEKPAVLEYAQVIDIEDPIKESVQ